MTIHSRNLELRLGQIRFWVLSEINLTWEELFSMTRNKPLEVRLGFPALTCTVGVGRRHLVCHAEPGGGEHLERIATCNRGSNFEWSNSSRA